MSTPLFEHALKVASSLPQAEIYQFTDRWDAARVVGKWFMIWEGREPGSVNVKAHPTDGEVLREEFSFITPGYHMNKKHWVTVRFEEGLTMRLLEELIVDSYLNVLAGVPKKHRPVDPGEYAETYTFRSQEP